MTVLAHKKFTTGYHQAADAKAGIGQQGHRHAINTKGDRRRLQIIGNLRMRLGR